MSEPPRSWGELPEQAPAYDLRSGQPLHQPPEDLGFWTPHADRDDQARYGDDGPPQWSPHAPTPVLPASGHRTPAGRGLVFALVGLAISVLIVGSIIAAAIVFGGKENSPQATGSSSRAEPEASRAAPTANPSVVVTVPGPVVTVPGSGSGGASVQRVAAGHFLNRRAQPDPTLPTLGQVRGGQSVTVVCQLQGPTIDDPSGARTNVWDRLDDGSYVTDLWIDTDKAVAPGFDSNIPLC